MAELCLGLKDFNLFQIKRISAYLTTKKAETVKEKEHRAVEFIEAHSESMRLEYCGTKCPLREVCPLTRK